MLAFSKFFTVTKIHEICKACNAPWEVRSLVQVSIKTLVGTTIVLGTVAIGLPALGFAGAGVAAGSIAAGLQGPAVAAGSWFAACQSLGATGAVGAVAVKTGVATATTFLSKKAWGRAWGKRS